MNNSLNTSLRIVVAALACAIFFAPVNANAYTSTGADGYFQPGASIVLDLTQPIFNFTSIFIPGGKGVPTDRGGILASEGGDINITGGANLSVGGGDAIRSGVGSVTGGSGAISIVSGGGIVNTGAGDISGNVSLLSPVPEPDGWALFAAGLVVTGFTAYRRRSVSGYQK